MLYRGIPPSMVNPRGRMARNQVSARSLTSVDARRGVIQYLNRSMTRSTVEPEVELLEETTRRACRLVDVLGGGEPPTTVSSAFSPPWRQKRGCCAHLANMLTVARRAAFFSHEIPKMKMTCLYGENFNGTSPPCKTSLVAL